MAGASATLRAATAAAHDAVDRSYARFDLGDPSGYRAFLLAHARALPAAERALADRVDLPAFPPRTPLLAADLHDLGTAMPAAAPPPPLADAAAAWGLFYVVEGSRLGGVMLARGVGDTLPRRYLSAGHARGGWRAIRDAIDAAAAAGGPRWTDRAVAGAAAGFALYAAAADAG